MICVIAHSAQLIVHQLLIICELNLYSCLGEVSSKAPKLLHRSLAYGVCSTDANSICHSSYPSDRKVSAAPKNLGKGKGRVRMTFRSYIYFAIIMMFPLIKGSIHLRRVMMHISVLPGSCSSTAYFPPSYSPSSIPPCSSVAFCRS